jgi:hypothetical protein
MDQLDRLIDEAAAQIVRREPSDALTSGVMDRVSASQGPAIRGGLLLCGFAGAAATAVLVVAVNLHRAPPSGIGAPPMPASAPVTNLSVPSTPPLAPESAPGVPENQRSVFAVQSAEMPSLGESSSDPVSLLAPIGVEPLSLPAILLSDQIQIAPLTIEPISASND